MQILSHRGFWEDPSEKNLAVAFKRTVSFGFGTETDFRDYGQDIVVSHDMPHGGELRISELLEIFAGSNLTIAANIKSDGIAQPLKEAFGAFGVDYFCFDMSVPQAITYVRQGMPFYTRHSDLETVPVLYDEAQGVWLDAFKDDWYDEIVIREHIANGKKVCIVSPELHSRSHTAFWKTLKSAKIHLVPGVALCTDLPEDAATYFA